ncbi:acyltransferase [Angustibacter peucedani]
MKQHLGSLDGVRAIAVLAVMTTHVGFLSGATGGHVLPGLLSRFDIGVAFFFVLSGFLLYTPHVRAGYGGTPAPDVRRYALHRVTRIVPAWLVVLPTTLMLVDGARRAPAGHWLANLLMVQTWKAEWQVPGLNHLWSLSTEMAFYVALPLLALLVSRLARRDGRRDAGRELVLLGLVLVLAWAWRLVAIHGVLGLPYAGLQWLPATLDWFAAGMLLAVVRRRSLDGDPRFVAVAEVVRAATTPLRLGALLLLWLVTTRLAGPYDLRFASASEDLLKHVGYTVIATLVIAPCVLGATDGFTRWLGSGPMRWLGTISYGLFLWHLPVLYVVRQVLDRGIFAGGFWVSWLLTLVISVLVASISWYLLEQPLLERVRRRDGPRSEVADQVERSAVPG